MHFRKVPEGEFELFYLVELTKRHIKPLSRWEKPMNGSLFRWLKHQGLIVDTVPRKTLSGKKINETIFSTSSNYVDFYRRKFLNSYLTKAPEVQRLEGFLFGYPSCCVSQFIQKPYIKNNLAAQDQRQLFHWSCPDCRATSELLNYYLPVHQEVADWYKFTYKKSYHGKGKPFQRLSWAAAVAIMLAAVPLAGHTALDTSHFIPVNNDLDGDGLSYAEEIYLGTGTNDPFSQSPEGDNQYWTQFFKTCIDTLPTTPQTDRPYKIEYYQYGTEECQVCGATVNMGYVKLVNPLRNIEMDIPVIALHFMESHCFSYEGSLHTGRVDIDSLKQILYPFDTDHMLPVAGDTDGDGLTDIEEGALYFDPGNNDTDGDGLQDAGEVAEQLVRLYPKLKEQADNIHSHITLNMTWGMENCTVCGCQNNMGFIEFHNPETGDSTQLHFNGLHALAHGSFSYDGTTNPGQRADAVELYRTMKTHMLFIGDDSDNDGLTDAEEAYFGYDPNEVDSNSDDVCDGMELALSMKEVIDSLPTTEQQSHPYVIHHYTWGHWNCLICGEEVNMGYMEVVNPEVPQSPIEISYYAYHFLSKGSFAYEGRIDNGEWIEGRIDPIELAECLAITVDVDPRQPEVADATALKQNYPNPFNPVTNIEFTVGRSEAGIGNAAEVSLEIFDVTGKKVAVILDKRLEAGTYSKRWDGRGSGGKMMRSGIYFMRLSVGDRVISKKMILLR
jgi:hypothetical protein